MRTFDDLRLLGDQVLVRCLGTADKQGSIHIPESAQEGRKIHQSGGDYLHRGEVVKVGPGDKTTMLFCDDCRKTVYRTPRRVAPDSDLFTFGKCHDCGGSFRQPKFCFFDYGVMEPRYGRAEMLVSVGDIVLYENRRDAKLQPRRFPSLGLDEDTYVILLAEQHVLAVIE